jgi:hypothetical protein
MSDSAATPWNSDGFYIDIRPTGNASGRECIFITYKIDAIDTSALSADDVFKTLRGEAGYEAAEYDSNAGVYVYHTIF